VGDTPTDLQLAWEGENNLALPLSLMSSLHLAREYETCMFQCTDKKGQERELTSKYFIVATGGRPKYPDIPGLKEYCISR
jgi:cation diffusion facilitator CzcD-associated flavoprotein CzcO